MPSPCQGNSPEPNVSAAGNGTQTVSLDGLLEAAARRHRAADGANDFLPFLLHETRDQLSLSTVALWKTYQREVASLGWLGDNEPAADTQSDVASVGVGDVAVLPAESSSGGRRLLAGAALVGDHELVLDATESDQAVDEELLIQLADVFADLQRRRMLERHLLHSDRENSLAALVAQLHGSLDPQVIANTVATDGAAVLDCRRVAVARRIGSRQAQSRRLRPDGPSPVEHRARDRPPLRSADSPQRGGNAGGRDAR